MKKIQIILCSLIMLLMQTVAIAGSASPVGLWRTIDDATGKQKSIIRISENRGVLSGKIVKIFPRPGHYKNGLCDTCEGQYKNKKLEGVTVLRGMSPESKKSGTWSGGKITDPKNGKTYRCTMTISGNGRTLDVRGYVGVQFLGRTQVWRRVSR